MVAYAFFYELLKEIFGSPNYVIHNRKSYSSDGILELKSNGTGFQKFTASKNKDKQLNNYKTIFSNLFLTKHKYISLYKPNSKSQLIKTEKWVGHGNADVQETIDKAVNQILLLLEIKNDTAYTNLFDEREEELQDLLNNGVSNDSFFIPTDTLLTKGIYYLFKYNLCRNNYKEIYFFILDTIFEDIKSQNSKKIDNYSKEFIAKLLKTEEYKRFQVNLYFKLLGMIKNKFGFNFVGQLEIYSMFDFTEKLDELKNEISNTPAIDLPFFRILNELKINYGNNDFAYDFAIAFGVFIAESNSIRLRYESDIQDGNEYIDDFGVFHVRKYNEEDSIALFDDLWKAKFNQLYEIVQKTTDFLFLYHSFIEEIRVFSEIAIELYNKYFSDSKYISEPNYKITHIALIKLLINCDVFIHIKPFMPLNTYSDERRKHTCFDELIKNTNFSQFGIDIRSETRYKHSFEKATNNRFLHMTECTNLSHFTFYSYLQQNIRYIDYYHADLSTINIANLILYNRTKKYPEATATILLSPYYGDYSKYYYIYPTQFEYILFHFENNLVPPGNLKKHYDRVKNNNNVNELTSNRHM